MGTRADFYIRKNKEMEYLGSIAWDGYEIDEVAGSIDEKSYRNLVKKFISSRTDGSFPDRDGWPWPWKNSKLTDEIWVFNTEDNSIYRGHKDTGEYHDHTTPYTFYKGVDQKGFDDYGNDIEIEHLESWLMPDMSTIQNITFGCRSGVIVARFKL